MRRGFWTGDRERGFRAGCRVEAAVDRKPAAGGRRMSAGSTALQGVTRGTGIVRQVP